MLIVVETDAAGVRSGGNETNDLEDRRERLIVM